MKIDRNLGVAVFRRPYKDDKVAVFIDGRLVADYYPTEGAWRVRAFYRYSLDTWRETLCTSEKVAREVAVELGQMVSDVRPGESPGD